MRKFKIIILILTVLLLSACTTQPKVDNLTKEQKKIIYTQVKNEIVTTQKKAKYFEVIHYYHDALVLYESLLFYETYNNELRTDISKLEKKIETKRIYYYKKAMSSSKTKDTMHSLNILLRIDPNYKDVKKRYEDIKSLDSNKNFIQKLQANIEDEFEFDELKKKTNLVKTLEKIKLLKSYDDTNNIALKYENILAKDKKDYIDSQETLAISLYKVNAISKSQKRFLSLLKLDPLNINAHKYISIIKNEKLMIQNVHTGENYLKNKEYAKASIFAKKAAQYNPEYIKTKELIANIDKAIKRDIPKHLDKGQELYRQRKFKLALKEFQKVLLYEPDNNTSTTLVKKINNRLKTINELSN